MFKQLLTPIAGSLPLSFLVASLPILVVLLLLGVLRRPAWQASLAGLITALLVAVAGWRFPIGLALDSVASGVTFALWPVMWIVVNALLLYNIAVLSGRFDAFRDWLLDHLPNDRRVVLIVVGFCFGCLLEGIAGFGTPVAITSALLIMVGFPPLEALTYTLIFDTAPVAFGALGVPVTVLAKVTGLPALSLGAMIGRQLPFFAFMLPFYVMLIYGGAALGAGALAGAAGRGRQLRGHAVHLVQRPELRPDRRAVLAGRARRDLGLHAPLVAAAGRPVQNRAARRPAAAAAHGARRRRRRDAWRARLLESPPGRAGSPGSWSRSSSSSGPMPASPRSASR